MLEKVRDVLENEEQMKKIMGQYNKEAETKDEHVTNRRARIEQVCQIAKVTMEEYLKALGTSKSGYSIVLQRDLDELFINSYNPEWIRAWNGNMDIQIVLDFFAVITYVTDYYSKDDTGTLEVIKAALDQSDAKDIKEKMRTASNAFLTHRQMGEAEAIYKLLPSMTLKKSNVACRFVALGKEEERTKRWKQATEKEIESGRPLIKLIGHKGLWYQQQDMWSKYLRRPKDTLEEMCFAQFAKMYSSYSQRSSSEKDLDGQYEKEVDEAPGDEDEGYNSGSDEKFNYIMTYRDDCKNGKKLPEYIELENLYPG